MSIKVIRQGVLDTLQDTGRYGFQHWGINPGGAVDRYAARVVNLLVGNPMNETVIEMHFPSGQFLFEKDALIAIGGAEWQPFLNDRPLPVWQPVIVRRNTILQFRGGGSGMRGYLAIAGGIEAESWLGSTGTGLSIVKGGFRGRKLQNGDAIIFKECEIDWQTWVHDDHLLQTLPWKANVAPVYHNPNTLFFTRGKEWDTLTETSRYAVSSQGFMVKPASDRMGYQLQGPALKRVHEEELISSAVTSGTIQLLPSGQLIILAADHQTTGGYPRVGHIISAHLPKLAQLKPGQFVRFHTAELSVAEKLCYAMEQELHILQAATDAHLKQYKCR